MKLAVFGVQVGAFLIEIALSTEDRIQETGDRGKKTGVRSQNTGVRRRRTCKHCASRFLLLCVCAFDVDDFKRGGYNGRHAFRVKIWDL